MHTVRAANAGLSAPPCTCVCTAPHNPSQMNTSVATSLPERLRLETRDLHAAAERSGAMAALLHGALELPRYRALLRNLLVIYVAMELALDACQTQPQVAPLRMPPLFRSTALQQDLHALREPADEAQAPALAATTEYAQRLARLGSVASPALAAHAYVRYLGDLHGGQALKRVVARSYALANGATQFYEFGSDVDVAEHRRVFRQALAALPATGEEADLIVAEARWAFEQHRLMFEQLMQPAPV
jgi:heme oxygenase (biliverdin-producing, ferredoxin)